jgi:hypothetical protein
MKRMTIWVPIVVFGLLACKTYESPAPQMRQIKTSEAISYHQPMNIRIAWYPYENKVLKQTANNQWKVVPSDTTRKGAIPAILITYPNTSDSIWFEMDTRNATLGKLLKHSLMTQEPISRPLDEFLEVASCTKCHPSDVPVNFNR